MTNFVFIHCKINILLLFVYKDLSACLCRFITFTRTMKKRVLKQLIFRCFKNNETVRTFIHAIDTYGNGFYVFSPFLFRIFLITNHWMFRKLQVQIVLHFKISTGLVKSLTIFTYRVLNNEHVGKLQFFYWAV